MSMANEQLSMDSILSDEPAKKPEPAAEPAAPAAEPAATDAAAEAAAKEAAEEARKADYMSKRQRARNKEAIAQGKVLDPDTGQFVAPKEPAAVAPEPAKGAEPAKPAAPAAAPQQEFTEKERAFLRAAQEERNKRQAIEREIADMRAKAAPTEPAKTFWDDPEAALKKQQQELQQAIVGSRLQTSESIARTRYQDFDAKVAIFSELAMTTPGLGQQMLAAPDPAEFVYRTAANHQSIKDAGGVEALIAKAREEERIKVRTEVETELRAKADALAKARADLPPSLSDVRATGGASKPTWQGPPSMDSILHDK